MEVVAENPVKWCASLVNRPVIPLPRSHFGAYMMRSATLGSSPCWPARRRCWLLFWHKAIGLQLQRRLDSIARLARTHRAMAITRLRARPSAPFPYINCCYMPNSNSAAAFQTFAFPHYRTTAQCEHYELFAASHCCFGQFLLRWFTPPGDSLNSTFAIHSR